MEKVLKELKQEKEVLRSALRLIDIENTGSSRTTGIYYPPRRNNFLSTTFMFFATNGGGHPLIHFKHSHHYPHHLQFHATDRLHSMKIAIRLQSMYPPFFRQKKNHNLHLGPAAVNTGNARYVYGIMRWVDVVASHPIRPIALPTHHVTTISWSTTMLTSTGHHVTSSIPFWIPLYVIVMVQLPKLGADLEYKNSQHPR